MSVVSSLMLCASQKRRGSLRFLRPLEMRPSSIAPHPVESREAPTNSTVSLSSHRHNEKLPEVTGTSCEVTDTNQGNPGFPHLVPVTSGSFSLCL